VEANLALCAPGGETEVVEGIIALADPYRLDAVRAPVGDGGRERGRSVELPYRRTTSLPERRYLEARAALLAENEQNSAPQA
jgi:hypothetical protein